jgi:hypothetical protein
MSYCLRFALSACLATAGVLCAAEPAPIAPPPPSTQPAAPAALSNKIDSWFIGSVAWIDEQRSAFNIRGHIMPYASMHSQMERDIAIQTANIADPAVRHAKAEELRRDWQIRLEQARDARTAHLEMGFQLPVRGPVAFMNENDASGLFYLNPDRGLPQEARPVDVSVEPAQPAIASLHDLRIGDKVMIGFASAAGERTSPDAFALVRVAPQVQHYEESDTEFDGHVKDAGHTMERNLEKGANKIKHFFTGHDSN